MKYFKPLLITTLVCSTLVIPKKADAGIPTIDVTNLIQSTISAIQDVEQVVQTYEQIRNQVQSLEKQAEQLKNLNGDYLKHALLNSLSYKRARRYLPKTYGDVVALYQTASSGSGTYSQTVRAAWDARDSLKGVDAVEVYGDEYIDSDAAVRHQMNESNAMAAVGAADMSFSRVDDLLDETEDLMADMSTTVDAKAAADLNNRMQAQTQFLLAEMIRVQSTQTTTDGRDKLFQISQRAEDKRRAIVTELPSLTDVAGY